MQVVALLKAEGVHQEGENQGELAETLWAEMGLQPDAHITQVRLVFDVINSRKDKMDGDDSDCLCFLPMTFNHGCFPVEQT